MKAVAFTTTHTTTTTAVYDAYMRWCSGLIIYMNTDIEVSDNYNILILYAYIYHAYNVTNIVGYILEQ